MSLLENDPRDISYIALYVAIMWYKQISADEATNMANLKSAALPKQRLTPELLQAVKRIMNSPNFRNFNNIEKRLRVDRRDIMEALTKEMKIAVKKIFARQICPYKKNFCDGKPTEIGKNIPQLPQCEYLGKNGCKHPRHPVHRAVGCNQVI